MKSIELQVPDLLEAINLIKSGFGATAMMRFKFAKKHYTIETTSADVVIQIQRAGTFEDHPDKDFYIDTNQLSAFVRSLPVDGKLLLKQLTKEFKFSSGKTNIKLGFREELAFDWSAHEFEESLKINEFGNVIKFMGGMAPVMASTTNLAIAGIHISCDVENRCVRLLSTDSYRVSRANLLEKEIAKIKKFDLLIPRKCVRILKEWPGDFETIKFSKNTNAYLVNVNRSDLQVKIYGARIASKYPNLNTIFDTKPEKVYKVNSAALASAIKTHKSVTVDEKAVAGELKFSTDKLSISTRGKTLIQSTIDGDQYVPPEECEEEVIKIHWSYLLDAITMMDCENINIGIIGPQSPLWLQQTGQEEETDPDLLCLIAPVG